MRVYLYCFVLSVGASREIIGLGNNSLLGQDSSFRNLMRLFILCLETFAPINLAPPAGFLVLNTPIEYRMDMVE